MSKVVFITGGSSGIGKCIGEFLTLKGYKVYGTSRDPKRVVGSKFPLVALDVRDKDSIIGAIDEVVSIEGRLDILINNAGVGITGPIEEIPTEEIFNNFQVNVFGPIEVIKAALPTMRNQRQGLIINVTSIAGYMGLPFRGIYSSSKSALEMITEALRMELKPFNIEVTNVAPGDFATNIASGRYHAPVLEDSAYKEVYQMSLDMANTHVDSGNNPMEMAQAIYKIINTKKPKVRYKVGEWLQKFSLFLKKVLPSKTYEKMLMNHYKIK
ncbi:SDR family oxidoreductase [Myroides pelagicus]|uniref:SDR family NAD(P)-dependent oxidoreductase n=1 Tax=Myroides pelagicus TaxID=270914 RepID=A0A7K1GNX6_9FLAO|nr:SDR family oxidoreductase [Myroides pelagicus]MEC4114784.1 SDR family oxidoreductase [Myroides pelagicus]MTH30605.1 SDR family NAD(P)-dependent oxidoreductase [Myroides pelagicus]